MNIIPRRGFLKTSALLGSGLLLADLAATAAAAEPPAAPGADLWEIFRTRRSVRKFRTDPVPDSDLRRMIDAARTAPTSGNQQPWKFLVIRDRTKIDQMKAACVRAALERSDRGSDQATSRADRERSIRQGFEGYFSAPVYIVILTDNQSQWPDYNHWDGPMAAGYLMLAARALGYGTVFITDSIPDAVTREVLHIPDRYTRVCITPVGVPVEWPAGRGKKKLEEFIAYETL